MTDTTLPNDRRHAAHRGARFSLVAIALALTLAPAPASAQLGSALRRAAKQVDKQVDRQVDQKIAKQTASATTPTPDAYGAVVLELTSARVDQFIAGLSAGRAVLAGSASAPSRAALSAQREDVARRRAAIADKNAKASNAYSERYYASERCRNEAINTSESRRRQASNGRVQTDAALQQKLLGYVQQMEKAMVRHDTAEVARLQRAIEAAGTVGSARDDTLAADEACGAAPVRPAFLAQIDSLERVEQRVMDRIRQLEERAAAAEVETSGMTEQQLAMARERVTYYLERARYDSPQRGFSKAELDALGARKADLEKLL